MSKKTFIVFAALSAFVLATVAGCSKPAPKPVAQRAPAPVLESFAGVCSQLGTGAPIGVAYVFPNSAPLDVDKTAPKGAREELVSWLAAHQAQFDALAETSTKTLEELSDDDPSASFEKTPSWWMGHLKLTLLADASRHYQDNKPELAIRRIATVLRFGAQLAKQKNTQHAFGAGRMMAQACYKLDAMVKAGNMSSVSGKEMREILATIDPVDPIGRLRDWRPETVASIAAYREEFSGFGAGKKLAKHFEEFGVISPEVERMPDSSMERTMALLARKSAADKAKSLSKGEISRMFDKAEQLVEPIAIAIEKRDTSGLTALGNQLLADDTQILRLLLGGAITLPETNAVFSDAIKAGISAASKLGP